jgi:O-antigen/teichoic acid export membrane protein
MSLAKKVFGATFMIVLASGVARMFSIFSAPILTRLLGPAPYGLMALVVTFTGLASTVGLLGIDMSYARFFFTKNKSNHSGVERFCWRYAIVSSIGISFGAVLGWQALYKTHATHFLVALIVGIGTILYILSSMSQTRARLNNEYKRIAKAIVISAAISTFMTIGLAFWWRRDEWPLLIGSTVGILVTILWLGIPEKNVLLKESGLDTRERWRIVQLGLVGSITAPMYWVLSSSDRWFINFFWGKELVGIYSFACNIATVGHMVNSAIILSWFPESVRTYEESEEMAPTILGQVWGELFFLLAIVWLTVTAIGGDLIRLLSDPRFHSGVVIVPWVAGGVFFYGLSHLANTGLLISKNMKPAAFWWAIGAGVNVVCNYFLIQIWGALGASIINCLSFALIFFGVMWKSLKLFRLQISWRKLLISSTLILLLGLVARSPWHDHPLVSLLLKAPVCLGCSLVMARFIAPEWLEKIREIFVTRNGR